MEHVEINLENYL